LIVHRVDIVAVTDKRDLDPAHLDTEHPAVGDIGQVGGANILTHQSLASTGGSPMFRSSSISTAFSSRSRTCGTPIRRIMSLKKPCTTSRRASSSVIPRLCR